MGALGLKNDVVGMLVACLDNQAEGMYMLDTTQITMHQSIFALQRHVMCSVATPHPHLLEKHACDAPLSHKRGIGRWRWD